MSILLGLLLGAGQVAASDFGRLDGLAGGGQFGLGDLQRLTGGLQLRRLQRTQGLAFAPRLFQLCGDAGQAGLGVAAAGGLGVGASLHGG
ncbi:hypothetical protein, partial [uncultured Microbacterium sp.]|uniref:hypothetical protein n=1 Tax=uncultured Microbacterium sp. TaxID=191216 RepID=UPI002588BD35